ncbi:ATP-binding protein [Dialister sp.]|jgi:uncharacterized protein|uniref:ATP-binding protein n=1 Tax=Dialister sp. TaxID=1955814 RepID=UPI003A5C6219
MFIGRENELSALEERYKRKGFEFPVIYGRRRVGKTRLIQEFIKHKRAIYFMATEQGLHEQLVNLTSAIKEQFPDRRTEMVSQFSDFDHIFSYLADIAKKERLIFIIDEYPYLAKAAPEVSSILQKYIDHEWKDTQLYLILCGSSMSFMERQVLGYESPLYGRRTSQFLLHPLPYYEAIRFFPDWSDEDKLLAYGIVGGIPLYLQYLSGYSTLAEAVQEEFLTTSGHLGEEPANLMLQELREPAIYNSILAAIAHGASRPNEIAQASGRAASQITFYLKNLMDLEIVTKVQPLETKNTRKGIYRITDNLYRFWYRFIPECASLIAMGLGKRAWDARIQPFLSDYFGHIFEDIALQYVKVQVANGAIPQLYFNYGSWWGTNPDKHREEEIDLVCTNDTDILCGECKWKNEPVNESVLKLLHERAGLITKGRNPHYALFSKSGFTKSLVETAENNGTLLVDLPKILHPDRP